jgi:hypothetical protein
MPETLPGACNGCGTTLPVLRSTDEPEFCLSCMVRLPESLRKAICDPFDYALRLRTGEIIRFSKATVQPGAEWICLEGAHPEGFVFGSRLKYPCPRGIDVRVSQIVWCADAPEGS